MPRALFFIFFLFSLCVSNPLLTQANSLHVQLADSVHIEPPKGYTEVSQSTFPELIASIAVEVALQNDALLYFFVKENEYPLIINMNLDEISGTMVAAWCQDVSITDNQQHELPSALTSLRAAPRNTLNPSLKAAMTDGTLRIFSNKAKQRHQVINAALAKSKEMVGDKQGSLNLDPKSITAWLAASTKQPQTDLALGAATVRRGVSTYSWLQSDDNSLVSYGMPLASSVIVTYGVIEIEDKKLALIFTDRVYTTKDVEAAVEKASHYFTKIDLSFSQSKAKPLPKFIDSYSVLNFLAREWVSRDKLDKATNAYKTLLAQSKRLKTPLLKVANTVEIGWCYLAQANVKGIINEIEPAISEAQKMSEAKESLISLYFITGYGYSDIENFVTAESYMRKGLELALVHYGQLHEESILFESQLASILLQKGDFLESKKVIAEALAASLELLGSSSVADLFTQLSAAALTTEKNSSNFFCKIASAHLLYAKHADDGYSLSATEQKMLTTSFKSIMQHGNSNISSQYFQAILNTANTAGDTPYNKGRSWMRGPEIELYAKYGEVASLLEKVGGTGTEEEKKEARANFQSWLQSVDDTLKTN